MINKKGLLALKIIQELNKNSLRHKDLIQALKVDRARVDSLLKEMKENKLLEDCKIYTISQNVKTMPVKNVIMMLGGLEKSGVNDIDKLQKNYLERTLVGRIQ